MKMISHRHLKIARELKKQIASIIQYELKDPRFIDIIISISSVSISCDSSYAKIYINTFSIRSNNIDNKLVIYLLQRSSKMIRCLLARKMYLRTIPFLRFIYDDSFAKGRRITNLISRVLKKKYRNINT